METKEQLLDDFKDLIQTLQGENLKNEKIVQLWREKYNKLCHGLRELNRQDLDWWSEQYGSWHKKAIEPLMTKEMKRFVRYHDWI